MRGLGVAVLLLVGACGLASPPVATVETPPRACERRPLITGYCESELMPQLYDCVRCPGMHGCVEVALSAYCVDARGCEDARCTPTEKARRDDALLAH